ncbi:interferon regulatory factor 8-like isoform X4 [Mizuhopecten yessoensis]|uniref:interferon regulatory factor 8-like isoform X4 n=1 Tax=Mizuhopecten yessoensis TaxID=6573 RepID=UPI000B45C416|nr:interferon regulatory factor 8-like isoform X4 [Mizuhopecten yessoensis]
MRKHQVVMDTPSRQRLRPWLEAKINSNTIPGLKWLSSSQQIFRVPWKHGGKHDWHEEDSLIFKEWAVHTGRYREGVDTAEWPTWKTRFRCALNKLPDITEVKDMSSLDGAEPYRAYKFIPRRDSRQNRSPPGLITAHTSPELEQTFELPLRTDDDKLLPDIDLDFFNEVTTMEVEDYHGNLHNEYEMDIKLMYRHLDVYQSTCCNAKGCRLSYGQEPELVDGLHQAMFGPDGIANICFPPCDAILKNQKQVSLTNQLLNALDRGVILECENGNVYATRKCKCVVFVSSPSLDDRKPVRLQRDTKTLIFDYKNYFEPMVHRYYHGFSNKPSPEILFGFGQNWRANDQPLSNLLIAAVVGCAKARHVLSQIGNYSLPMEVSKSDDLDKFLKCAKIQEEQNFAQKMNG